jgi:hypothetical protein
MSAKMHPPSIKPKPVQLEERTLQAIVLYSYDAADQEELTIREGDTLLLLSTKDDSGWIKESFSVIEKKTLANL